MAAPLILVVDDDADVRPLAASILREAGFRVLEAADGDQAVRILDHHRDVALIFTDIVMPGLDGIALAQRAKSMRPEVKIIYATGFSHLAQSPGAALHGIVLQKPYRPAQLEAEIRHALA